MTRADDLSIPTAPARDAQEAQEAQEGMRCAPEPRLKIAVLTRHFTPTAGGAERYAMALVQALCERHEVHVFAQRIEHAPQGVHYHGVSEPLKHSRWMNQWWYAYTTWQLTRQGFDVVHSHENTWHAQVQSVHVTPAWITYFKGSKSSKGLLAWCQTILRYAGLLISPRMMTYLWLEHRRLHPQFGKHVVSVSKRLELQLLERFSLDAQHLSTVSPGVDEACTWLSAHGLSAMDAQAIKRHARERLGLDGQKTWLLWVGNDARKKGLKTLLEALAHLPEQVHLMVVGQARHADRIMRSFQDEPQDQSVGQSLAQRVAQRVQLLGSLADVSLAYLACDVLTHPTLEDTFGMVVLEAMSFGRPVCVSAPEYCGIAADLTHQEQAFIVQDPRDAQMWVQGIEWILEPKHTDQLAQSGLEWSKTQTWQAKARDLEQVYLKVWQGLGQANALSSESPLRDAGS